MVKEAAKVCEAKSEKLEDVAGVSRVSCTEHKDASLLFEVQSQKGQLVRGDLARAIVASGWDLYELRSAAKSLEEVFLQLTGSAAPVEAEKNPAIEQPS